MFPIMLYDFLLSETEAGIFRQILRGKLDFESEPWPSISDSAKLCYTDTSRKARIAYPIRIGYGYVSDTPRIRIVGVSEF